MTIVILGGLPSSTALNLLLPALYARFGREAPAPEAALARPAGATA